jgi:hypothetical protein
MAESDRKAVLDWTAEDEYWRSNYKNRPYTGPHAYDYWEPGYRYGYESAERHQGKRWEDVEHDLRTGWDRYEHRGASTWEQIKHAVRDGWDRVTGRK